MLPSPPAPMPSCPHPRTTIRPQPGLVPRPDQKHVRAHQIVCLECGAVLSQIPPTFAIPIDYLNHLQMCRPPKDPPADASAVKSTSSDLPD